MTLQALTDRVRPPASVPSDASWVQVQRDLAIALADDVRVLLQAYGHGYFEPGVVLYDPRRQSFLSDISVELKVMADPDLGFPGNGQPHAPYPGSGERLLPLLANGSGAYVMAVLHDGVQKEREYWLANLDSDRFSVYQGALADLLLSFLEEPADGPNRAWRIDGKFIPL